MGIDCKDSMRLVDQGSSLEGSQESIKEFLSEQNEMLL